MLIVTTDTIFGKSLEMLGLVEGSTIQSKHIGSDISQSFKTIVGGELRSYTDMMNKARALATKRMVEQAEAMGADAIVCVRYTSAAVMQGAAEILAYGTAVKFAN
ncbi:MAG: YbjQ family protein [Ruminococcaceae bacterium]|nr:YbjQ family protein [Oscillospiraceae bacterium]